MPAVRGDGAVLCPILAVGAAQAQDTAQVMGSMGACVHWATRTELNGGSSMWWQQWQQAPVDGKCLLSFFLHWHFHTPNGLSTRVVRGPSVLHIQAGSHRELTQVHVEAKGSLLAGGCRKDPRLPPSSAWPNPGHGSHRGSGHHVEGLSLSSLNSACFFLRVIYLYWADYSKQERQG